MANNYIISAYQPVIIHEPSFLDKVFRQLQREPEIDRFPQEVFYVTFGGDSVEYQLKTSREVRSITEGSSNRLELKNLWGVEYISNRPAGELMHEHINKFGGEKKKSWPGYGMDFIVHNGESEKMAREIGNYYAKRGQILIRNALALEVLREEGIISI